MLDAKITASRPLRIFFWELAPSTSARPDTQWECLQSMKSWGLQINDRATRLDDLDAAIAWFAKIGAERDSLKYEIDGCVFKVDSLADQAELGIKSNSPRWAVAWKFPPRQRTTRIVAIEALVGRTGALTPVAVARADPARRRHRGQREPPQPGRDRPQGHPGGRLGAGRARRRRHPARGAGDRRQAHRAREEVPSARSLPGVRQRSDQAGRRGDHALRQHLVPGAGQGAHPPLRQPRRHGHRRARRQAGRPARRARLGEGRRRPLRPHGRDAGRARAAGREERAEPGRRDRVEQAAT